ncbi:MAG TPA: YpiF family protein [Neobacillus sp.]|jgi:hypothetical protein
MKWTPKDVGIFMDAKEYVDTAVIPLYSVSFEDEMKQSAATSEFLSLLTTHLERQFTGRILLFPPFTYLKKNNSEIVINELKNWESYIEASEFKHIFYITAESEWRLHEQKFTGSIVWLPMIPHEIMDESQKLSIVESHAKELMNLFTQKWQENK